MALVQALPVPTDHPKSSLEVGQCRSVSHSPAVPPVSQPPPSTGTMGSVSSLISSRGPSSTSYQERHCRTATTAAADFGAKCRKAAVGGTSCFRVQDGTLRSASSQEQLLSNHQHHHHHHQQFQQHQHQLQLNAKKSAAAHTAATVVANNVTNAAAVAAGNGNYGYVADDLLVGDWNDNLVSACSPCSDSEETRAGALNGNIGGPPPKLIPVSGKLEKSMEKILIRPTAFKPVIPKNRNSVQYLSPRPGGSLSESQGSLNLLLPVAGISSSGSSSSSSGSGIGGNVGVSSLACSGSMSSSSSSSDKRNSYSGGRHGGRASQSGTMSDSGRNSLSSLPTYSGSSGGGSISAGYSLPPGGDAAPTLLEPSSRLVTSGGGGSSNGAMHGHSNSDSGRSSSSKSTGSLSGRGGQPLSDSGSCERSPAPTDGYEGVIRDLEEKLREREQELQQLRDNLDENEAAICQVYEEKQKRCEQEMEELRQSCAAKMKQAQQKAQRGQQVLQLQVYQLQQEKKKLQEDFSQLLQERELLEKRCASIEREQTQMGPRLEETKWEVCQKSGEISLLKQQLKDVQAELTAKAGELVSLRAQLREARGELQASQVRSQEAHAAARTRSLELEVCENELQRRKSEAELLRQKLGRVEEESARLRDALAAPPSSTATATGTHHLQHGQYSATLHHPHHNHHHHNNNNHHHVAKAQQCMSLPLPHSRAASAHSSPALLRECAGSEDQLLAAYESDEAKVQRQQSQGQGQCQGQGHGEVAPPAAQVQGLRQQVDRMKAELMLERRRSEDQTEAFETERRVWQEEKDKVIRYQKQLQQNYIQMYRRNRELERVMRQLSLELETRDLEEFEMRSGSSVGGTAGEIHFEEITATEI
ncbi:leucine zipper putative tumor suppressor 2a [Alosa pseudoharengus]|uniref:leucine zipper putative tumor suppressor 2 homolog n=1 Tax=Alosa pseudoharengus TaxID=34774 RepID=UPI003F8B5DC6